VGALGVVVLRVAPKDLVQVSSAEHEREIKTSWRTVRTNRSANALALGARTGVLITRAPSEMNTSSKARVYLESRSLIRNA
jgi:hypothetical protein